ncbi:MAG: thioredoxin domain-containing protein [Bacteroidota bacterium]|jgi:uncharacterized protein YyaL (SSP411 family)
MNNQKHTNPLIHEKSPYLLQHAHNPVNWLPWNDFALEKAATEDKLIIVSIGYSACHWCHVMENESFEDEQVAQIMNDNFICIKVDREERPDIDQVYMSAVQIMTGHGGWPLNCITLPNGKPLYGGTYFPKAQWSNVLLNLVDIWKNNKAKALEYAEELTQGLKHVERLELNESDKNFSLDLLHSAVNKWKTTFDLEEGGPNRAPKFPMPNNWLFLLRYYRLTDNTNLENFVHLTLQKLSDGGIYDHVGGGFARYSTDIYWKVPHFEKMLYDNAQLISLYAEAFRATKNERHKHVAIETIQFVERELMCDEGGFYSALDADSEGEEGKFYVWEMEELQSIISESEFSLFAEVFSLDDHGYWEDEKYILLHSKTLSEIAMKFNVSLENLQTKISSWKSELLKIRNKRTRPGLDDKILASWNALMIKAYCDAFTGFGDKTHKENAITSLKTFISSFENPSGGLFHSRKKGQSYINGFLEDYAFAIDAALSVFLIDARQEWLDFALSMTNYSLDKFFDDHSGMFYFTSSDDKALVVRKAELSDNVIPASNSMMARNLFALFRITGNTYYRKCAERMLNNILHELAAYISSYSNWGILFLEMATEPSEIIVTGPEAVKNYFKIMQCYKPGTLVGFSTEPIEVGIFKGKFEGTKNQFHICINQACKMPEENIDAVLKFLNN